jgi:FkbH-like protein
MKYSELIKANNELQNDSDAQYKVAILSNIMVHQTKEICEYLLRIENVNANVYLGDYDNILQDSLKFKNFNAVIIFWEISNLIDGFHYKANLINDIEYKNLINKVKTEIDLIFSNLKETSLVLVNRFSTLAFDQSSLNSTRMGELKNILNGHLYNHIKSNVKIIDIDKVISKTSVSSSTSFRYYKSHKTLYSVDFFREYFSYINPIILSVNGVTKKALIFDCDNTLWKGVLGEDGVNGIEMYQEVQSIAVELAKQGVIVGLCSKNNYDDVDDIVKHHKGMILNDQHIVIKKINWNDKVSNLKEIASELNINMDSVVFIDDSEFEVNLVREHLPMVKVFLVPPREYEYSMMIREVSGLFYNSNPTSEDIQKVGMYKTKLKMIKSEKEISNIEDYLKSLEIEVSIYADDIRIVKRISQMTQKTNQFNLTTKRYTETDIEKFIKSDSVSVLAFGVKDKFGDNGISGLVILDISINKVFIDTFLLSCRVLGRNIEYRLMDAIIDLAKKSKVKVIDAEYIKTLKNEQVEDLYDRFGFEVGQRVNNSWRYQLDVKKYQSENFNYIGLKNGR